MFSVKPDNYTFSAPLPVPSYLEVAHNKCQNVEMKATQIPIVVNNATTGHKLQGSGVDNLLVHGWYKVANWNYVMLS